MSLELIFDLHLYFFLPRWYIFIAGLEANEFYAATSNKRSEQDRRWVGGDSEQTLESKEDDNPVWASSKKIPRRRSHGKRVCRGFRDLHAHAEKIIFLILLTWRPIGVSRSPTRVITANGEVHINEEGTGIRTNITRAPVRQRTSNQAPHAEEFDDLITANHKVPNEACESRNGHRNTVIVQDFATQCPQADLCKTMTAQETEKSLQNFLEDACSKSDPYRQFK